MTTQHDLSSRHPDVVFTSLPPGAHGTGAIWKIHPRGSDAVVMYAHDDEQADRYAVTVVRAGSRPGHVS